MRLECLSDFPRVGLIPLPSGLRRIEEVGIKHGVMLAGCSTTGVIRQIPEIEAVDEDPVHHILAGWVLPTVATRPLVGSIQDLEFG